MKKEHKNTFKTYEKEDKTLYINNNTLSMDDAIKEAKKLYKHRLNDITSLYISNNLLKPIDIKNNWNEVVFREIINEEYPVWLIFFDTCKFSNWGHLCEYTLLQQRGTHFSVQDNDPPIESISLKLIQ